MKTKMQCNHSQILHYRSCHVLCCNDLTFDLHNDLWPTCRSTQCFTREGSCRCGVMTWPRCTDLTSDLDVSEESYWQCFVAEAVACSRVMLMQTATFTQHWQWSNALSQITQSLVDILDRCIQLQPHTVLDAAAAAAAVYTNKKSE